MASDAIRHAVEFRHLVDLFCENVWREVPMASDAHRPLTEETLDRWHRYLCLQEGETDSHRLLDIAGQLLAEVRRLRSALSRKDPCEVEKTDRTLTLSNGTVVRAGEFYVLASDQNEARQVDCFGPEVLCYFVWEFLKGRWYRTDCETMGTTMLHGTLDWRPWSEVYPDRPVPHTEKGPER